MLALWQLCQKAQFSWPIGRAVKCLSGFSSLKGLSDHAAFEGSVTSSGPPSIADFSEKQVAAEIKCLILLRTADFSAIFIICLTYQTPQRCANVKIRIDLNHKFVKENKDDLRSFTNHVPFSCWIIVCDGIDHMTSWSNPPSWRIQYPYDSYHPQNPYNKIPTAKGIYHIPTTRSPLIHPFSMRWQSRWTTPIQPLRFGDLRISETVSGGNYTEYPPGKSSTQKCFFFWDMLL